VNLAERQREFIASLYGEVPLDDRAAIYRRNLFANLRDALAAAYPVIRRLVGNVFFDEAADRYARAHPSGSGDLHRHGESFAEFLAQYAPARDLAYLADVARLEWAVATAFHAGDARVLDLQALGTVPDAERHSIRLTLQPAAFLLESDHPIGAIWEANQADRDGTPARAKGVERVLVYREDYVVRVRSLADDEWALLGAIGRGATLGEMADDPTLAPALARQLPAWARLTVIDGFERPCSPRP
jgi:hypothetical protein